MAPRTSLACILTGPSRSAPDSDFIFLDGTLNQVPSATPCASSGRRPSEVRGDRGGRRRALPALERRGAGGAVAAGRAPLR